MRVLITSGGTKIPIDKVRSITNMSKGTFGSQIAESFGSNKERGEECHIDFLMAKESKGPYCYDKDVQKVEYETFWDYERELMILLKKKPDIVVLAAAVSDYEVEDVVDGKMRSVADMLIKLKPLPKLIGRVREMCPEAVICGFKLLVNSTKEELIEAAENSIKKNDCDLVIANDLRTIKETNEHSMIVVQNGWHKEYFRRQHNLPDIVRKLCITEYIKK